MMDKTVLLFKQDLDSYPIAALRALQRYLDLPDTNREDLLWLIAIHQAQRSQKANFPVGPPALPVIAAGFNFSVGILENGDVFAWGGWYTDHPLTSKYKQATQVAARSFYILALLKDGSVVGWNYNKQVDIPDFRDQVIQVAAGDNHSLALLQNGSVISWDTNGDEQGDVPDFGGQQVIQVAAGYYHSLALLENGSIVGWGDNRDRRATPPDFGDRQATQIAAGDNHSLALLDDGTVVGWGDNTREQINIPDFDRVAIQVAAGGYHSLALLDDGTVVGWGSNRKGYTISGQIEIPYTIQGQVIQIAAGGSHSLALLDNGSIVGWGDNDDDQSDEQQGPFLIPATRRLIKSAAKR